KSNYRTGRLTVARLNEQWVRETTEADVCIYGGTSGGVVAAVQAARMGKRVILLEPGGHLGGMTSGGLSAVDIGDPRSVGGLAREYFTRLVARYGKQLDWDQPFRGHGGPATGGAYSIEPHVAELVFEEMVREAGVDVWKNARLNKVQLEGKQITDLILEDGRVIRARMFLDTTYEGDLMAAAGVSYTLMREGNDKYGEQYNGIHYTGNYQPRTGHKQPGSNGRVPGGQGVWDRDFPLDPYVIKGNPSSGLLPFINEGEPGNPGEPAPGVQAYCFRLCMTTDPENMIPISPPEDYNPDHYELIVRFIEACLANGDQMDLRWFSKHDPLPNHKWDFNTATFGGNLPGLSWTWPEASYEERQNLAQTLENYHRGLLYFLSTDSRVPESVRNDIRRFGFPKDEFVDHAGWPHQVYIREGRRMVSDLVMTEHHTFGREIDPHPIGLGSYGTDTHEIRRIVKDGVVTREGKTATGRGGFGPYGIAYGAIVPRQSECSNLFVTFALSASHTAFSSIRMEPVFMVTSQSAATAACLAMDAETSVQQVDYNLLKAQLLKDGQVLQWTSDEKVSVRVYTRPEQLAGIVLDDDAAQYTGAWTVSGSVPSPLGTQYRHDGNQGQGMKSATFTLNVPNTDDYEVRLLYTAHSNRSSKTKVSLQHENLQESVTVDQRKPCLVNRVPQSLGIFRIESGSPLQITITNQNANGIVVIDGLQLVPRNVAQLERTGKQASGYAELPATPE
ncbi:MAG: FAD-dependent oxidoreductase, partial [Planctomycetaceae bacterium]|nr:FAD-dependent oxidoreductase [Planctomycetaceae bacterium]